MKNSLTLRISNMLTFDTEKSDIAIYMIWAFFLVINHVKSSCKNQQQSQFFQEYFTPSYAEVPHDVAGQGDIKPS